MGTIEDEYYGAGGEAPDLDRISCLGEDRKLHVCFPWDKITKCGVKIIKKDLTDEERVKYFSCYECTY